MTYTFKALQEIAWGAVVAFLVFLGTAFLATESVTDWRAWAIAAVAGAARAAVAVIVAALTKSRIESGIEPSREPAVRVPRGPRG